MRDGTDRNGDGGEMAAGGPSLARTFSDWAASAAGQSTLVVVGERDLEPLALHCQPASQPTNQPTLNYIAVQTGAMKWAFTGTGRSAINLENTIFHSSKYDLGRGLQVLFSIRLHIRASTHKQHLMAVGTSKLQARFCSGPWNNISVHCITSAAQPPSVPS